MKPYWPFNTPLTPSQLREVLRDGMPQKRLSELEAIYSGDVQERPAQPLDFFATDANPYLEQLALRKERAVRRMQRSHQMRQELIRRWRLENHANNYWHWS